MGDGTKREGHSSADRFDALAASQVGVEFRRKTPTALLLAHGREGQGVERPQAGQNPDHVPDRGDDGLRRPRQEVSWLVHGVKRGVSRDAHAQAQQDTDRRARQHDPEDPGGTRLPKRIENQLLHDGEVEPGVHVVLPSRTIDRRQGLLQRAFAAGGRIAKQGSEGTKIGEPALDEHGQPIADLRHLTE